MTLFTCRGRQIGAHPLGPDEAFSALQADRVLNGTVRVLNGTWTCLNIGAVRVNCTLTVGAAPSYAVGELVVGGPDVGVVVISDDSRFLYLPRFAGDVSPTVTHAERSMAAAPVSSPMDGKPGSCELGNLDCVTDLDLPLLKVSFLDFISENFWRQ